jgi:hypothetical protein
MKAIILFNYLKASTKIVIAFKYPKEDFVLFVGCSNSRQFSLDQLIQ